MKIKYKKRKKIPCMINQKKISSHHHSFSPNVHSTKLTNNQQLNWIQDCEPEE